MTRCAVHLFWVACAFGDSIPYGSAFRNAVEQAWLPTFHKHHSCRRCSFLFYRTFIRCLAFVAIVLRGLTVVTCTLGFLFVSLLMPPLPLVPAPRAAACRGLALDPHVQLLSAGSFCPTLPGGDGCRWRLLVVNGIVVANALVAGCDWALPAAFILFWRASV